MSYIWFYFNLKIGGYYAVYGTSFGFTIFGIIYVYFIPESVIKRDVQFEDEKYKCCKKWSNSMVDSYK